MNTTLVRVLLGLLALLMFVLSGVSTVAQAPSPEDIVAGLAAAVNDGDIEGAMLLFEPNAFVNLVPGPGSSLPSTMSGTQAIRAWLEGLEDSHFRIEVEVLETHGDLVMTDTRTWTDETTALGVDPLVANEIYVIQDGQIAGFTWVLSEASKRALMQSQSEPITAEDLVGTWHWNYGSFYLQFAADGSFRASDSRDDLTSASPQDLGTYTVENGVLTMISGEASRYCAAGDTGVSAVSWSEEGELVLMLQRDDCANRRAPSSRPQPFYAVDLTN